MGRVRVTIECLENPPSRDPIVMEHDHMLVRRSVGFTWSRPTRSTPSGNTTTFRTERASPGQHPCCGRGARPFTQTNPGNRCVIKINAHFLYEDFYEFGIKIGIKKSRVEKFLLEIVSAYNKIESLTANSFMSSEAKAIYLENIRLSIKSLRRESRRG